MFWVTFRVLKFSATVTWRVIATQFARAPYADDVAGDERVWADVYAADGAHAA